MHEGPNVTGEAQLQCPDSDLVPSLKKDLMHLDRGGAPLQAALGQYILTF